MLIAHISDFHVFADKPETKLVRPDAAEAARKVVNNIARFAPALDAVAFTGDLTDGGSQHDYALLKDILAPLKIPVLVVPGNHDRRATLRAAFATSLPFEDGDFLNYEVKFDGLRVLALDSLIEGHGEGRLEPETLDWLRNKLSAPSSGQTLLLIHHPPFPSGIASLDKAALTGGQLELEAIVRACRGRIAILAGHIHRPFKSIWNGAYCAVGGSPAFQMALDLAADAHEPPLVQEPYAYFVYRFDANGIVAHTRYVTI